MEKKKINKNEKITIIIGIVIVIIAIILLILFKILGQYNDQVDNNSFEMQMKYVDKDIVINVRGEIVNVGENTNQYFTYYIDIDKKKIYKVDNYETFGKEPQYILKNTKELTDEEVKELIDLINIEFTEDSETILGRDIYYIVSYKDKDIAFKYLDAQIINKIINGM